MSFYQTWARSAWTLVCTVCEMWSVCVCVWKCQVPRSLNPRGLDYQGCVPACLGTRHRAQTVLTRKGFGGRVYLHVCVWERRKITEQLTHFLEKRAKPGCLTSLIDALPRNLSLHRVNQVACDILESEAVKAVLLQRQKEMRMDGEMQGVQRGRWQGKKRLIYNV